MFENIMTAVQQSQNGATSTFEFIFWLASVAGMWKMFEKAGEPGWIAIIPFYNLYKLCEICMGNPWYWLRLLVVIFPLVGWIGYIYFSYVMYVAVARSFGKPDSYAWGLLFLQPIFNCMLGFGEAEYYGVNGAGDRRTSQAKGAKTVNFEVIKDEPSRPAEKVRTEQARPAQEVKAEPKEETVDFTFDQPEE